MKQATVRARVTNKLKKDADAVLDELGLSMSEAIRLFLTQVVIRQGFPIELNLKQPDPKQQKSTDEDETDYVDALLEEIMSDNQD